MNTSVPRVAVAGLGGFAAEHHRALAQLEADGVCRVVATCDPDPELRGSHPELAQRGVAIYSELSSLIEAHSGKLEMLTLPTPIPLHAEQHRMAVEAGVPCYLEKPPSLCYPEFQSMREVERNAVKATHVGFNFVGDPMRRELKKRILSGEFGRLREVRFRATWPRDAAYFARNNWAGRLRVGDKCVNDSVIGNAMAHYVQNLLFWCGPSDLEVGAIHEVRAWLGRTRPIESFDTALVEAVVGDGVLLRIAATHAESQPNANCETLTLDKGQVKLERWDKAEVLHREAEQLATHMWIERQTAPDEHLTSPIPDQGAMLRHNLSEYLAYVAGDRPRPVTRLEDAEPFVALHALAMASSETIADIETLPDFDTFLTSGRWPAGARPRTVGAVDVE